mmetsp:Transcript_937/g.2268  ORF Transcript_937/g.2268 Transcript_937/m.2268 type:complete len:256 (+) Transcript_937:1591-2358(+)
MDVQRRGELGGVVWRDHRQLHLHQPPCGDARDVRERDGVGLHGGAQGRVTLPGSRRLRVGARHVRADILPPAPGLRHPAGVRGGAVRRACDALLRVAARGHRAHGHALTPPRALHKHLSRHRRARHSPPHDPHIRDFAPGRVLHAKLVHRRVLRTPFWPSHQGVRGPVGVLGGVLPSGVSGRAVRGAARVHLHDLHHPRGHVQRALPPPCRHHLPGRQLCQQDVLDRRDLRHWAAHEAAALPSAQRRLAHGSLHC